LTPVAIKLPASRSHGDRLAERALFVCAAATALTTLGILVVLADGTVAFFRHVPVHRFFGDLEWTPLFSVPRYGIWPLLAGTVVTSALAVAVAVPCGVLAAIFLAELAHPRLRRTLKPMLELLAGVPTLVYGAFALIVVTPLLQQVVPGLAGFNALSPGLVMGLMLTATVTTLVDDALRAVPRSIREGAWALGSRHSDAIVRVVVPAARSGIVAAATLVAARAVGETMIVAIAAGQQPRLTLDPRVPIETMTAFIMQVSMGDVAVDSDAFRSIFVVAAALFLFTFALNMLAHRAIARDVLRPPQRRRP
jgi:phosphate transport system permease protein